MQKNVRTKALALAIGLGALGAGSFAAQAEPGVTIGIEAMCPATGPGIVICAGVGTLLHELVQAGNGKEAFGPNGEIMKILSTPVKTFEANAKGAKRESGEIDKALRFSTGISAKDIREYGLWGGPNSIFRKPFG